MTGIFPTFRKIAVPWFIGLENEGCAVERPWRGAPVAYPGIFFGGGVQQIQLRTGGRENGDLGAVAP